MIVFGEPDRHIDIWILRPVFIAIERFRIDVQILGGFAPGKPGGLPGFQQVIWLFAHASSPPHKILTDIFRSLPASPAHFSEDAEVIAVEMYRDRIILLIQRNQECPVAVILQLLDVRVVV